MIDEKQRYLEGYIYLCMVSLFDLYFNNSLTRPHITKIKNLETFKLELWDLYSEKWFLNSLNNLNFTHVFNFFIACKQINEYDF